VRARVRAARRLVDFDSGVNMVRALGRFLKGRDHGGLSVGPSSRVLADAASMLPAGLRRRVFPGMGLSQGLPLDKVRSVDAQETAQWVVAQYGRGPYPVVAVGSASGAALHLAAALRAPYLPQTTLVSVRDLATHPDDPVGAMHAVAPLARMVARRNPEVSVYHMHDPAQDRPMLEAMAYLRLKRHSIGRVYERFLEESLAPGGTILVIASTRSWRVRQTAERCYFQFGCLGGVSEEKYHNSGERIADYLARQRSPWHCWAPPEPDVRRAEAEWGFDRALLTDLERIAIRCGYQLRLLVADEPQDFSPFVADLYRSWYRDRGLPGHRLLVESYVQWDPLWTLKVGAVPFWMRFNMRTDYHELERYLATSEPYDDVHLNLFSQGLWSPGVVPIERWRPLVEKAARKRGDVIGVDADAYPLDTGSTMRFQPALETLPARHASPAPLTMHDVDCFAEAHKATVGQRWRRTGEGLG
jgi:hypothetical protein